MNKNFVIGKQIILYFYKLIFNLYMKISYETKKGIKKKININYGGSRSGNLGGGKVKIKRLKNNFPENIWRFNLIYLISNSVFLNEDTIKFMKKKSIPIVLNQNGVFYPGWYDKDWKSKNKEMSIYYKYADYVFWQSNFCKKSANKFLGLRDGSGEVLYNAVDTDYFLPKKRNKTNRFSFLMTGNFSEKSLYTIENTIQGLAFSRKLGLDSDLYIAGWSEKPSTIFEIAKRYNISKNIFYLGYYNQNEAPKIYQSADAFVSTKYLDPCPNSVIEALSCGLPVLYSASGGTPELVDSKSGIGLKVKESWTDKNIIPNPKKLGEGMVKIYENHNFFKQNARNTAIKRFDIKNWIGKHKEIFEKLLNNV